MGLDKEKIQASISLLNKQLWKIEAAKRKDQNSKLVGKCFKYRNSYSCPSKPSDYWWSYSKVIGLSGSDLKVICFDIDKYGKFELEETTKSRQLGGYKEIKKSEFRTAQTAFKNKLNKKLSDANS